MKKMGMGIMLALAVLLAACGKQTVQEAASRALEIDVSAGEVLHSEDSHGGFHGDGTAYAVLQFEDGAVLEQIQESGDWKPFPLDETVQALVYGVTHTSEDGRMVESIGPYLTDEDGKALVPEIGEGYYRLIDRQAEEGKATGADILHGHSLNFTLGLYDAEKDILYLCVMDT